ncbi:TFG1 [Sanghuangporus weigelae]
MMVNLVVFKSGCNVTSEKARRSVDHKTRCDLVLVGPPLLRAHERLPSLPSSAMAPSPSPAPSASQVTIATQAQQPNGVPNGVAAPPGLRRPKKEVSLFHKKPSRPFALAAMQAANGNANANSNSNATTTGAGSSTARANQNSSTASRASPIPKPPVAAGSPSTPQSTPERKPSPSGASTPSNSQGSISTSAVTPTATQTSSNTTSSESAPAIGYQDFRVVSTDRHGWKYDVMKFESRNPVDINVWARPVKLNRKEVRRVETNGNEAAQVPVGPMLGPDGKPVIGADGRVVMVDVQGRPIHDSKSGNGSASTGTSTPTAKNGKDDKNKKKKFQKKTRQVFLVPEHIRQLRKEERYPWVMEDAAGKEIWEGRMEEASKAELFALFMPAPDSVFRFVPAHRWYKFQKRRTQQHTWSLEEAEKMMAKMQKNKDGERWLLRRRNNNASPAPTPGGLGGPSLVYNLGGMSLAPGGRRLRTVDAGMRGLFEEDDEEGVQDRRRRERERDFEGDMDEMEYEEDFADDEEKVEPDDVAADEEAKELEERLKREYRQANKTREGYIDEDEEEEDADNLTGTGKDIKKLVRKIEKNAAYESDEDKNPYASSEEEEEEETPIPTPSGPAVQDQSNSRPASASQSKPGSRPGSKPPSRPGSRSGSPAPPGSGGSVKIKVEAPGSPLVPPPPTSPIMGMGGHSVLAKRATSPKPPVAKMLKGQGGGASAGGAAGVGSRATSPLAGRGSRAGSPNPGASRATSPAPMATASPSKKRKADGDAGGTGSVPGTPGPSSGGGGGSSQPKFKKRKPVPSAGPSAGPPIKTEATSAESAARPQISPGTELTASLLVAWLRTSPGATTRECIHYFQPALTDDTKKARFTALVKEVASLKGGVLALKAHYRDGNGAVEEGKA